MGQARKRGTYAERKQQAIKAGRIKKKEKKKKKRGAGVVIGKVFWIHRGTYRRPKDKESGS